MASLIPGLGNGLATLGRFDETLQLNVETLSIRERVLGPEHPDTLLTRNSLAVRYRNLGRTDEADALDTAES